MNHQHNHYRNAFDKLAIRRLRDKTDSLAIFKDRDLPKDN